MIRGTEIGDRIVHFLGEHPPFSTLDRGVREALLPHLAVRVEGEGTRLFRAGDPPLDAFFLLRKGAVSLRTADGTAVDTCDEGDVFGLRPLLAGGPYALDAVVTEEAILYVVPIDAVRPLLEREPGLAVWLARSFAAHHGGRERPSAEGPPRDPARGAAAASLLAAGFAAPLASARPRPPVTCAPGTPVAEAARRMSAERVGSIVTVDAAGRPLGILTDKDLRRRVLAAGVPPDTAVEALHSAPVRTVAPELAWAEALALMLDHGLRHLVLTEGGRPDGRVLGVVSEHDLLVRQASHPAVLATAARRAPDAEALRGLRDRADELLRAYLEQELAMETLAALAGRVNDAVTRRCVVLAEAAGPPPGAYAWLSLGSAGRGEQLFRTDQDNALVFDEGGAAPGDRREAFLALARRANDLLEAVGYERCPADMMAGNPDWCLGAGEWARLFGRWAAEPDERALLHATIFFDFRAVHGQAVLAEDMTRALHGHLDREGLFLPFLARNALASPPPLSFFRRFIVERSGEHRDAFDLKARALMPLVDAARVLALEAREAAAPGTAARFRAAAAREPANAGLFAEAAESTETVLRLRAERAVRDGDTGRYLDPATLGKADRLLLRHAFTVVDRLQQLLRVRFRLDLIR